MKFASFSRIAALICVGLALTTVAAGGALGVGSSASPWVHSTNSKVRLVSATVEREGKTVLMAGIQLRMNPEWKTYWKNPGDSGVPPGFDWTGSTNLKHAKVLYPAPHRFAEADGWAIGYDDEVVFPIKITPEREDEPVTLRLGFDYGLCKDLCIPNEVSLRLTLGANAGKGDAALIETFFARVPKEGAPGILPEVKAVEAKFAGKASELIVDAAFAQDATGTDLFIDGGDVFVPVPRPVGPLADGKQRFAVSFASPAEAAAIKGKPLTLTLVSDQGSTATVWTAK